MSWVLLDQEDSTNKVKLSDVHICWWVSLITVELKKNKIVKRNAHQTQMKTDTIAKSFFKFLSGRDFSLQLRVCVIWRHCINQRLSRLSDDHRCNKFASLKGMCSSLPIQSKPTCMEMNILDKDQWTSKSTVPLWSYLLGPPRTLAW